MPIKHVENTTDPIIIQVAFAYSEVIWPWSGFLAVHLSVASSASAFDGVAEGHVSLTIESPAQDGDAAPRISNIR